MARVSASDIKDGTLITNGANRLAGIGSNVASGGGVSIKDLSDEELGVDDGSTSSQFNSAEFTKDTILTTDDEGYVTASGFDFIKNANNLRKRYDIDLFHKKYRFGVFNPYETLSTTKEFLFFTKPDLAIMERDPESSFASLTELRSELANIPFWKELFSRYKDIIYMLQSSCKRSPSNPFIHLLSNTVRSNLDTPSISAETVDTPTNMYGVNFSYRGSSEASNDSFDFSLEFEDTKYLPVYLFFKAYEEYENLKHHGLIGPHVSYIQNKVIHDQIAIYKFLVDDDMETIIYYAKYYGVMPVSLPRDVFSSSEFADGLKLSIGFKAAFFDDMDPMILADFNALTKTSYNAAQYRVDIYNEQLGRVDNRPCTTAKVSAYKSNVAPGGYVYKLKWKGNDTE